MHDRQNIRIHERLAAGDSDLLGGVVPGADLIQEDPNLIVCEVNKPIVLRAGLDVAVFARDIAEGAGVEPKGFQCTQGDACARLSLGGKSRIGKRSGRQLGLCIVGHVCHESGLRFQREVNGRVWFLSFSLCSPLTKRA